MQTRIGFITGVAVGYVLGARAGRARYEQIKKQADTLWNDPRVQEKVGAATETVKAKAPEVQARLTQAVQEKAPAVGQKLADVKDAAADKAADVKGTAADKAADLKDAAAQKAADVKDKAADAKDAAADKAADAKDAAKDKAAEVKDKAAAGSDHTGNQIGVEQGSDVEPHEVKFESAD